MTRNENKKSQTQLEFFQQVLLINLGQKFSYSRFPFKIINVIVDSNIMEPKVEENQITEQSTHIVVPSKKIKINSIQHQLARELFSCKDHYQSVTSIKIEGNSYSLQFCQEFGKILSKTRNIKDLNINDMFVARLKQEIPKSIEYISTGLVGSNLLRLDISNNAVNPYGAQSLLIYLKQATSLQVLLIYNCGLGTLGVGKIAEGLKGTPQLRTLSIGRNRMENAGILSLASSLQYVPKLEQLFVYQNTLKEQGLKELFRQIRTHCKNIISLDICDNFVRGTATTELTLLLKESLNLKNLNLSDCLNQEQNEEVITAFEESSNRIWERVGYNFVQLEEELALRFLHVMKTCPLKRLDITGNDFGKKTKKAYTEAFPTEGVLSKFDDDQDEQEVLRLFEQLKI